MPKKQELTKGFFSSVGLSITKSYLHPAGRNRLLRIGALGALLAALVLLVNIWFQGSSLVSNGPLSSNHANFESDCQTCHSGFQSVSDEKCSVCHEKYGDELGVYSFDTHYIYRSLDYTRAFIREGETPCFGCHSEHMGRNATLTSVADAKCLTCHPFGSFNSAHPQFQFAAHSLSDDERLTFTHIRHVTRVQEEEGIDNLEAVCLYCHTPRQDGRSFDPIDFDQHCNRCHLRSSPRTRSANLSIRDSRRPILEERQGRVRLNLGVETPETVQERQAPGDQWALSINPAEFRIRGSRMMKMRLHHRDPWILHNLKMLRRVLYPSPGLADLLDASADVKPHQTRILYQEALATLAAQSDGLRSRSDGVIQEEVEQIDRVLESLSQKLKEESVPLDPSVFQLDNTLNPKISPSQVEEIEELVQSLTEPCQVCHEIKDATLSRVQKEQRLLRRAEFNHQAHIIQRRCLDCHTRIPFYDYLGELPAPDVEFDQAAIQNLPAIETCRQCHTPDLASNQCSTCHLFHPNQESHSTLLAYVE